MRECTVCRSCFADEVVTCERDGAPTKFFLSANPFKWHLKELANANKIRVQVSNLLTLRYFTMTPYLMGDRPAKFSMRPQVLSNTGAPPNSSPDAASGISRL